MTHTVRSLVKMLTDIGNDPNVGWDTEVRVDLPFLMDSKPRGVYGVQLFELNTAGIETAGLGQFISERKHAVVLIANMDAHTYKVLV